MDRSFKEEQKEEDKKTQFTHRYYCDACTNVAAFFDDSKPFPKSVTCTTCAKTSDFKKENLIVI